MLPVASLFAVRDSDAGVKGIHLLCDTKQDSSVSILIGLSAGFDAQKETFFSPQRPDPLWGLPNQRVVGLFPRRSWSWPLTSTIKNSWSYTFPPVYVYMAWNFLKHQGPRLLFIFVLQNHDMKQYDGHGGKYSRILWASALNGSQPHAPAVLLPVLFE